MADPTEQEIAAMRGAYQLLDKLLRDPKTRRQAEQLIKVHKPDLQTTDDLAAPYVEEVRELKKEFKDFLKAQKEQQEDTQVVQAFSRLKDQGYTEEGIDKIKGLMKDRLIPDPEAAAALFDKLNPTKPLPPSGLQPTGMGFGPKSSDPDMAELFKNEDAWAEKEAIRAFRETAE